MKKFLRVLSLALCLVLLAAATASAANKKPAKAEVIPIKVSAKEVLKPPYVIFLENKTGHGPGSSRHVEQDISYWHTEFKIVGKKDAIGDEKITGEGWEFSLNLDNLYVIHSSTRPDLTVVLQEYRVHEVVTGEARPTLTDAKGKTGDEYTSDYEKKQAEKREKRQKANEHLRKLWNHEITEEQFREEMKKELEKAKQTQQQPKPLIKTTFTIHGMGVDGMFMQDGIDMWLINGEINTREPDRFYQGAIDYEVELTVTDDRKAKAKITSNGGVTHFYELEGYLTCQRDIEVKMKASKEFPVWDTWTDEDIYAPLPKILKDYDKRYAQLQARKIDPSAKVDTLLYHNGKWITLTKGKKITYAPGTQTIMDPKTGPNTYEMVEITDEHILYEKGEIWVIGDFQMRPSVRYRFPRDHQDNLALYAQPLEDCAQPLTQTQFRPNYNFVSDTLHPRLGFFMGTTLRRVREGMVCETWSSVKGVEKPDPKKVRGTVGVWYEFKLQKGEYIDAVDENGEAYREYVPPKMGGYTWERVTVKPDGSAELLSGMAEIDHFDSYLSCNVEKRVLIDPSGNATEETYEPPASDDEDDDDGDFEYEQLTLSWSDYDKSAGTIKINGTQFYKVTKSVLNGSWSTHEDAPPVPDTTKPDVRAAIRENYKDPVEWVKLDSAKREFTRVSWMCADGLLTETGTYKTLGDSQLVFENMKGTLYDVSGALVFKDEACQRQSDIFDYLEPVNGVMYVTGIGKMYKAK